MSKTQAGFSGLMGAAEAVAEAAKHLEELEQRYVANESSFNQIQKQFQQMQDAGSQLHSIAEERLAALAGLNVELKARHAQGEKTLKEVRSMMDELKVQEARIEKGLAAIESRPASNPDQTGQYVQAVKVLETVVQQVQARQGQLEQAQVAIDALLRDQAKKPSKSQQNGDFPGLAERQAQVEKALGVLQGTQQAEKGLIAHFEKSINTVRTAMVELEKRQSQLELSLTSIKANGKEAAVMQQSVDSVRGMIQDLADRQATLQEQVDRAHEAALRSTEQAAQLEQHVARIEKAPPAQPGDVPVIPVPVPENAANEFQQFLQRCEQQYRVALDAHQAAVQAVPAKAEARAREFFDAAHGELIDRLSDWCQQQEKHYDELNARCKAAVEHAASAEPPEWLQTLEASTAGNKAEMRFIKTLMWITLAAVGLAYGLVAYAVILRS